MNPLQEFVHRVLAEDLGGAGDITTAACIGSETVIEANIVARAPGVVAGLTVAREVLRTLDPQVEWDARRTEGDVVEPGSVVVRLHGSARAILSAERTALNLIGRLSGVATATHQLVTRVEGTGARIVDTRKTTPGLRALEKAAVRAGGGHNHRFGLYDAVLIKDNHIVASGGIRRAVELVRGAVGHMVVIAVEVDTMEQLDELLEIGADAVLLDNMAPETLRQAVEKIGGRMTTEASGNITAANVRAVAETGVDYISVGWITHSAPALDVALDICESRGAVGSR
ncbi:MAG: carboxylating nicotinate-nucleotide diphosphorylase [Acidimicrobiia bacterium]